MTPINLVSDCFSSSFLKEDFTLCGKCLLIMPITDCGCLLCNDCISTHVSNMVKEGSLLALCPICMNYYLTSRFLFETLFPVVRNEWTNLLIEDFKEKTKKNFISHGVEVVWNHKHIIGAFFFALYVIPKSIDSLHTIANSLDELKTTFVDVKNGLKSWIEDHPRTVGELKTLQDQFEDGGSPSSPRFWGKFVRSI
ncbi:PREDICTED: uncharacterized protein LOC104791397 isoform X2 [Camelina sativa]|uniref:Uncharacterized protein LOC104791397 isoform X2 n=1 Tax=Camelina sativa TaxID=90675 RepID=A0ABM1Q6T8_CAMSA|nr:PREDICTED: uncharacterized protein LOC104791397 isoform X2 [Camelina sativa]XP_019082476.1 PREDICTED: uncharacterized protein LOC104791397 isoform X2 [Camelina sativa]XP_019082477.1 PREDICTED: uncharacterized protein LOC104791397 isoform X2 [Camelina sativa]